MPELDTELNSEGETMRTLKQRQYTLNKKRETRQIADALAVLREFCQDVQAGGPNLAEEWPDLQITYKKAQAVITDAKPTVQDATKEDPKHAIIDHRASTLAGDIAKIWNVDPSEGRFQEAVQAIFSELSDPV